MSWDVIIARQFHESYERLAPEHQGPENHRALMAATVADLLKRGVISPGPKYRGVSLEGLGETP